MSQNENKNAPQHVDSLPLCFPTRSQTPFACQAMDSLLGFYLQAVLPTALAEVRQETRNLQPHVESIQQIFNVLKSDVNACVSLCDTLQGGSQFTWD